MPAAAPAAAEAFGRAGLIDRRRAFLLRVCAAIAVALPPGAAHAHAPQADLQRDSVALQIRASAGGKLKDFYRARGYWPLWIHDGAVGKEAARLLALIASADLDGLEPKRYDLRPVEEAIDQASDGSPEALARAELRLSRVFAAYVRDVRRAPGVDITYLDRELAPTKASDAEILREAALAPSFADYVKQAGWMSPIYLRLREALAQGQQRWGELPDVPLATGPMLRAGAKGERVAMLRRRLGLPPGTVFDKPLAAKLRAFQADHGLPTEGVAGDRTVAALNRAQSYYDDILRLNLERARILPGPWTRHIVVDTASARLWLYRDGQEQGSMKVVVGKPTEQTPMLAGMVRYAILNPYWNVPADLIQNRIAPRMLAGTAKNFQVLSDWGAGATVLDPKSIDWQAVEQGRREVRLRQLPGGTNAMGRMKFMFPNDQGIYLHDTPDRALFAKPARQFSSGCVRLEDAPRLGRWLFGKALTPASDAPEQQVPLPAAVPVYLTYLTAVPSGSGIAFPDDVYGRDGRQARQLARR